MNSDIIFQTNHSGIVNTAKFNYNGAKLVSGGNDGIINLFSTDNILKNKGNIIPDLKLIKNGHNKPISDLSFSHPLLGNYLASCSYDKKLIIWKEKSPNDYENIYEYKHDSPVKCCKFAPYKYGLIILCGMSNGDITIHQLEKNNQKWINYELKKVHKNEINGLDWAPASSPINIYLKDSNSNLEDDNDDDIYDIEPMKFISCGNDNTINIFVSKNNTINSFYKEKEINIGEIPNDISFVNFVGYTQLCFACGLNNGKCLIYKYYDNDWKNTYEINVGGTIIKINWSLCGTYLGISFKKDENNNEVKFFRENMDETWIEVI